MSEPSGATPRGWGWHIWVAIATALSGFFLAWLSSQLPTEEVAKRALTRALVPVLTPIYRHPDGNPITIVTIDDDDLNAFKVNWPMPLTFVARRLDRILALDPRAVFIDLAFVQDRSQTEVDALRKSLCYSRRPVFIAVEGVRSPRSKVEEQLFDARRAGTDTPCALPVNVRITPDELDQLQWAYPMHIKDQALEPEPAHPRVDTPSEKDAPSDAPNRSAALEIYCQLYASTCPDQGSARRELAPLALIWPAHAAKTNNEIMVAEVPAKSKAAKDAKGAKASEAAPPRYEAICRSGIPLWELLPGARALVNTFDPSDARVRARKLSPCPYHQVVPLRAFNTMRIANDVNATDSETDQAARKAAMTGENSKIGFSHGELGNAIGNKIVMIGGDVFGSGDTIVSPVHGRLPGVHVHAMALDNLIAFDGKYKEMGDFELKHLGGTGSLFVGFAIFLIVGVLAVWHRYFPEPPRSADMPLRALGTRHLFRSQLTLILCSPILLALGKPKFRGGDDAAMRRLRITHHVTFAVVNALLVAALFGVGYWFFRQGPLSMVEYVLFPFVSHFLHLGELVAQRGLRWWQAFHSADPWRHWSAPAPAVHDAEK